MCPELNVCHLIFLIISILTDVRFCLIDPYASLFLGKDNPLKELKSLPVLWTQA